MNEVYSLKIIDIQKETENSKSVTLQVPKKLKENFIYKPGQYITLQFYLKEQQVRRSYSLCSSPVLDTSLKIGVKRVENGLISNHVHENLNVGNFIDVLAPNGRFFAEIKKENYKTYYLFAAGSGITPIISILKTVLFVEEKSFVYMIYGNKNHKSIMFNEELKQLELEYKDRFTLIHTLSNPISSWSDLWKREENKVIKGRVDVTSISWLINQFPPYAQNTAYYICGPGTMINNTVKTLKGIDVPESRIFIESFGSPKINEVVNVVDRANLIVHLENKKIEISIPLGKTILRALLDNKYNPPYLCEGGVCGSCVCKVKNGRVYMKNNAALTDEKIKEGYVLSCQSLPLTDNVEIIY